MKFIEVDLNMDKEEHQRVKKKLMKKASGAIITSLIQE